ncbi:hypothetical protein A3K62_02110 [Candidatus Pacearchaeota archaeon RBG_16_35_8]|nr:MAG: hypothetical protein A3K62_02110 [Candidatus Pacearchaeota archaeon RBG_16_35_8]
MSHLKRHEMPKTWAIPRKGTAYVVKPLTDLSRSIPLLIVLRDFLKVVQNRHETKRILHLKQVLLNSKEIKDEKAGLYLFDVVSLIPLKKSYRIELSQHGKFEAREIKEGDAHHKIAKIINKKTLKGKKTQLNLSDGRNFLSEMKCQVNDSVLVNLKESKIDKCLPLKEGAKIMIVAGKHIGESGIIKSLDSKEKMAQVESNVSVMKVLIKQLIVTE